MIFPVQWLRQGGFGHEAACELEILVFESVVYLGNVYAMPAS
jgi:hypothetical protein